MAGLLGAYTRACRIRRSVRALCSARSGRGGSAGGAAVWIAARRGLPAYHEIPGLGSGGYAWVFGDAVKEPRP